MTGVLAVLTLAVLLGLAVVSIKREREITSYEKQQAESRTHVGDEQREHSLRSRDAVRATHAQSVSDADPRGGPA